MDKVLKPLTALGAEAPLVRALGPWSLTEVTDVALASLAPRRGRAEEVAAKARDLGLPLPGVAAWAQGPVFSAFWLTPEMWMVEAPMASHDDIRAHLVAAFGDAASITEQSDAWVRLDLAGPGLERLFEKLCNLDLAAQRQGFASRTVIEHMGCYLIRHEGVTLYGARSMAGSLVHAITEAAVAQGGVSL